MIKCCINIWEKSLVTSYTVYLEEAKSTLQHHHRMKLQERESKHINAISNCSYTINVAVTVRFYNRNLHAYYFFSLV